MEISHVEMEHINEQNLKTNVSPVEGFAPHAQEGVTAGTGDKKRDIFEMDSMRLALRKLCNSGQAMEHIDEIIESEIEPTSLRAELAYRASLEDTQAISIVINYLAGNFKQALFETRKLAEGQNNGKLLEFLIFSDYLAGNYDRACERLKSLPGLEYSPFLCYAYADMLLSLGYVEDARKYVKKYEALGRKHLNNFVSEKERYDEEKKRHEQNSQRGKSKDGKKQKDRGNANAQSAPVIEPNVNAPLSPAFYRSLQSLLKRRRVLLDTLKTRNLSIDKRPLLFELEDIEAQIGRINSKFTGSAN